MPSGQMEELLAPARPIRRSKGVKVIKVVKIIKLKVEKNAFAIGLRDPSIRSPECEPRTFSICCDSRPELLVMPMCNPMRFQQALLSQCVQTDDYFQISRRIYQKNGKNFQES
ncbi:hypothetical protein RB195_016943 [Necator americanus]|uniref:Uncharacterized protein n=1 Tax=Necator americanus TaxID=51031 RepID=A0ABR1C4C8_NECAM